MTSLAGRISLKIPDKVLDVSTIDSRSIVAAAAQLVVLAVPQLA